MSPKKNLLRPIVLFGLMIAGIAASLGAHAAAFACPLSNLPSVRCNYVPFGTCSGGGSQ